MSHSPPLSPWGVVHLGYGLSLVPHCQIHFSFTRASLSVRLVDEWQLKECLKALLHTNLLLSISDSDLVVSKDRDAFKKRRDATVATAILNLWPVQPHQMPLEVHVEKLNDLEISVSGLKLRCRAQILGTPGSELLSQSCEGIFGRADFGLRTAVALPDTLIVRGVPSLWLSEPLVSSKASILVTHTIFSKFGIVRNLEVLSDGGGNTDPKLARSRLATALNSDVWVQFENHASYCDALQAFCGRALAKEGSSFKANYTLEWDKDAFFSERNIRKRKFERDMQLELGRREFAHKARMADVEAHKAELARVELQKCDTDARKFVLDTRNPCAFRDEEEKQKQGDDDPKIQGEFQLRKNKQARQEGEKWEEKELSFKSHEEQEQSDKAAQGVKEEPVLKEEEGGQSRKAKLRDMLVVQEELIWKVDLHCERVDYETLGRSEQASKGDGAPGDDNVIGEDEFDRWMLEGIRMTGALLPLQRNEDGSRRKRRPIRSIVVRP